MSWCDYVPDKEYVGDLDWQNKINFGLLLATFEVSSFWDTFNLKSNHHNQVKICKIPF